MSSKAMDEVNKPLG